jgi:hypothetical protein
VAAANRTAGRTNISIDRKKYTPHNDYKVITRCTASPASQKIRHTRLLEAFVTIRDVKGAYTVYIQRQLKIEPKCFSLSHIGVPSSFNSS